MQHENAKPAGQGRTRWAIRETAGMGRRAIRETARMARWVSRPTAQDFLPPAWHDYATCHAVVFPTRRAKRYAPTRTAPAGRLRPSDNRRHTRAAGAWRGSWRTVHGYRTVKIELF